MSNTRKKTMNAGKKGFTLTEVLVAITLTLIILGLMIRAFSITGGQVAKGRAILEMAGQLRTTGDLLRKDLSRITVNLRSFNRAGNASGYFEYIEGPKYDMSLHTKKNG
ncbi:MAG: prepilin-type N-terminal cleavage/methylation domain-containing protein, partial [Planctomycetota bacterium]|nr:prepilin-type N-terminal cleavage/methylation domain-containing protein [Planctomycetota bacterium]